MFPIRNPDGNPVAFTGRALHAGRAHAQVPQHPRHRHLPQRTDPVRAGRAGRPARRRRPHPSSSKDPSTSSPSGSPTPTDAGLPRAALAACGTNLSPDHIAAARRPARRRPARHHHLLRPRPRRHAATERAWQLLHTHRDTPAARRRPARRHRPRRPDSTSPAGSPRSAKALTHRARPCSKPSSTTGSTAFFDRHADRPDSPELRVAAVHTVADLLTHAPPDQAPLARRTRRHQSPAPTSRSSSTPSSPLTTAKTAQQRPTPLSSHHRRNRLLRPRSRRPAPNLRIVQCGRPTRLPCALAGRVADQHRLVEHGTLVPTIQARRNRQSV